MSKAFAIVIVNWNLKQDTSDCIESLLGSGAVTDQIWVVDNGSEDGSVGYLQERFGPALHVIDVGKNTGFAEGVNIGLRASFSRNPDWFLLVNNDTLVSPEFLAELKSAIQASPAASIIGAAIYYHSAPDRLWYLGDRPVFGRLITINPYRGKPLPNSIPDILPVDYVNGCGMLVRRDVFEKVGFFDSSFFMYGEEVEFCLRARKAGFQLACATRAKMWHKISQSSRQVPARTQYLRTRNQIWIYRKYSRGIQQTILFLFSIYKGVQLLIGDVFRHQFSSIKLLLRGWKDGWFADSGKGLGNGIHLL